MIVPPSVDIAATSMAIEMSLPGGGDLGLKSRLALSCSDGRSEISSSFVRGTDMLNSLSTLVTVDPRCSAFGSLNFANADAQSVDVVDPLTLLLASGVRRLARR